MLRVLSAIIFFPGMVLHELGHAFACVLLGVKVTSAKLWGPGGASITHNATSGWRNLVISLAPFFVNSAAALAAFALGHYGSFRLAAPEALPLARVLALYWLGTSFAYYSFPSDTDLRSGWSTLWRHYKGRMMLRHGALSGLLHWATAPLLIPAWAVLSLLGVGGMRRGYAWAVVLFLAAALWIGL